MRPGLVVGIGIDAVEIDRFRAVVARRPGVVQRLFADHERAAVGSRRDDVPGLAARFAAKEAVMKALGVGIGQVAFHDITIAGGGDVEPSVSLTGAAARRADHLAVDAVAVSLTHTRGGAHAVAVATRVP